MKAATKKSYRQEVLKNVLATRTLIKRRRQATPKADPAARPKTPEQYRAKLKGWPKRDVHRERDFIIKELQADLSEAIDDLIYLTALNTELDTRNAAKKGGAK